MVPTAIEPRQQLAAGGPATTEPIRVIHVTAAPEFARLIMRHEITRLGAGLQQSVAASPGTDLASLRELEIPVHPLPIERKIAPFADLVSLARLIALFRRERPDVIHTYTPKAGLLGQLAGAIAGVPLRVHSCRGLLHRRDVPSARRGLFRLVDRLTARLAHRVLFVSRADHDYLVTERLCPPHKARHVGSGVDLGEFRRPPDPPGETRRAVRASLGYRDSDLVVLTVGRFVPDKGYLDLARAIPLLETPLERVRFLWVAPVMGGEEEALSPVLLEEPILRSSVQRLERRDDLPDLYLAADLLVHPSHREGVPRVIMEAAAMGLPILASDIEGNREVVELGRTAVGFEPGNPAALAAALDWSFLNRAALETMAEAASRDLAARFDVESLGPRIRAVYDELLEARADR